MWDFVIQTLGLFLIFKFGPQFVRFLRTQIRLRGRGLPPPRKMDKEKNNSRDATMAPPSQTAAVDQSTAVANETVIAFAQNELGAASAGTQAAALASMSSNTSTARAVRQNEEAQAYSRFTSGVTQCMTQYAALGTWLGDQICNFEGPVDISAIHRRFMDLTPVKKVLIMIVVLGLVGLLGWFAWEGVQLVWPHVMNFLNSAEGISFLGRAGDFLAALANSQVMITFVQTLTNAAGFSDANNGDTPTTRCFEASDWAMLTGITALSVLELINLFFAHMSKNAMDKK